MKSIQQFSCNGDCWGLSIMHSSSPMLEALVNERARKATYHTSHHWYWEWYVRARIGVKNVESTLQFSWNGDCRVQLLFWIEVFSYTSSSPTLEAHVTTVLSSQEIAPVPQSHSLSLCMWVGFWQNSWQGS